nr:hypothetical protein [Clostridia bacterium]
MGLLKYLKKKQEEARKENEFEALLESGTKSQLEDAYEERRIEWLKNGQNGTGEKTLEMKRLDRKISEIAAKEWENDPRRNKDPNFRWTDANRWDKD